MFPRVLLFLSTPSARRATRRCCSRRHCGQYFYPRPLRGGRPGERGNFQDAGDFYPRPLRGGRPPNSSASTAGRIFLSTPSARRATQKQQKLMLIQTISIHALCEEGDNNINKSTRPLEISIHALCEEGDPTWWRMRWNRWNFYPRPLRGGRQSLKARRLVGGRISIHALCEEGDLRTQAQARRGVYFYPRPLRGGRPKNSKN